ncbi:MAG: enoyl-CoA hydratase/isomerase family protein [Sandaracinaceae bacterium]|nr:MAG: enoyl-CoA hydratase/isomerase family protein [Sandaracinaceae bacterium]
MTVRHEERGRTAVLTVDRPETKNAIDPSVHAALSAALDAVMASDARAIVLTGANGTFVSGGDLKLIRERPFEETLTLSQQMTALLDRLEALPVPVFAAIEGYAFGGGVEIALACDYRVAAPGAKLSFRQAAMGLSTGWGAATRLARVVPRGVAARLLMTAEVLDAEAAADLGLVEEVDANPLARCLALADAVASQSPRAVAAFKALLPEVYGAPAASSRAKEWEVFQTLWGAADHAEALDAFFGRRAPRW